jgi:branched-chain amino acid transport system ATP-binding protein
MLKLDQVHSGYGAIDVLKDLTLEVGAGEIVALLGANGAGKSTTLLTIAGVVPVRSGTVTWQGEPLPSGRADAVLRRGICLCPEGRHIFPRLTVLENLISGSFLHAERRNQLGGTLSGGEQQMLAIGRALMGEPRLLMLDEPSLGLAPQIVARIFEIILRINQTGVPILLVEQNARQALKIAHRGYVIVTGRNQLTGTGADLLASDEVRQAYLGE